MSVAAVLAGLGGLAVGSYANSLIERVPGKDSLVGIGPRCASCRHELEPRDRIPVWSWVTLRGRCRKCGEPISWRAPVVELLTGLLFALAALRLRHTDLVAYLPFMFVLVPLSFIDLERKILPNAIVLPSIAIGAILLALAAALGPGAEPWGRAVLGGFIGFAGFLAIAIIYPAGMGMGDVKFSALLGMYLGYLGWGRLFVGFFTGFLIGAVGGVALMLAGRGGRKTQIPFGPYLALGAVIGILAGGPIANAWLGT
jgi:leader peptidase (prepilin peptidase)/N-methyltransferase